MLHIGKPTARNGQDVTRREILRVGGLGLLGVTLGDWWRSRDVQASPSPQSRGREPSCIFIFLSGGPSHLETFDPKPNAPVNIRGPYGTIRTNVPGIQIGELLPALAQHMDKCAILRSMTSRDEHAGTTMMSGASKSAASYGAVLTKLKGFSPSGMPPFAHVGPGGYLPGAGTLGTTYNPVLVADPSGKQVQLPQFALRAEVSANRFDQRKELLGGIDRVRAQWHANEAVGKMDTSYQRAVDLLTSDKVRAAFDLAKEPEDLRTRYGGSTFGQSCILARRLVEAGTRFVQINWYSEPAWHGWDVHGADLPGLARMESPLCPRLDQGLSTLLEDLQQRGLLSSTLVVVTGEFGRTPTVNKYGGRDHWPRCFSVLFAGAGVPAGTLVGASDNQGGYPANRPVTVPEFAATLYRLLGINTNLDPRIRPFIGDAAPVAELV
ncbi:MAG: DUF1501 domain-containing protein [Planctomycetes bacterium]|nr:DUF1501 domain-containing protein [Planctomycetota bacterium]